MKILVDADSCPVKDEVIRAAKENYIPVILILSLCHVTSSEDDPQITWLTVDNHPQEVDLKIINMGQKGDIVVTGDWGLAAMCLGKGMEAISFKGDLYRNDNIEELLFKRHLSSKIRRSGGKTKGPSAFTGDDKKRFIKNLLYLIFKGRKSNIFGE